MEKNKKKKELAKKQVLESSNGKMSMNLDNSIIHFQK